MVVVGNLMFTWVAWGMASLSESLQDQRESLLYLHAQVCVHVSDHVARMRPCNVHVSKMHVSKIPQSAHGRGHSVATLQL